MTKQSYDFVLDCSITMAWCFEDESTEYTDAILDSFKDRKAVVPSLWSLEVANVLLLSMIRERITEVEASSFVDALSMLPIIADPSTGVRAMHSIFVIANRSKLTTYDAAYLELALREKIPLLTLDKDMLKAAKQLNVPTNL